MISLPFIDASDSHNLKNQKIFFSLNKMINRSLLDYQKRHNSERDWTRR